MATYPSDDLTPLFAAVDDGPPPLGYRQGIVRSWDNITAANTVEVDGALLTDLPCLNTSDALLLRPGDVVSVVTFGGSWAILGRLTIPGTQSAASALSAIGSNLYSQTLSDEVTTTEYGFEPRGGPAVTVPVRASGRVIMWYACTVGWTYTGAGARGAYAAVRIDHEPLPQAEHALYSWAEFGGSFSSVIAMSVAGVAVVSGMSPGDHYFEMEYSLPTQQMADDETLAQYKNRSLVVLPL